MSIDRETVRRVAHLARIALDEGEIPDLTRDLAGILAWAEQLAEIDVEGVEPMTSVTPMALPLRADDVTDGDRQADVLANAPDARMGFFAVPKVVE